MRADALADALWPHVDADYAHKSFTATLHRLRRILGEDDALRLRDGRLSLNPALFWLDSWALDQLLGAIEELVRDRDATAQPRAGKGSSTKRSRCTPAPSCSTTSSSRRTRRGASRCARACCGR